MPAGFAVPLRPEVLALKPYVPGKPLDELERELGVRDAVKLASNENPLGPSPAARDAAERVLAGVHRYPDGSSFRLRRALSAFLGVDESAILLGNGSNEILVNLALAALAPGLEAVFADPPFVVYPHAAALAGARGVPVPLKDGAHDLDAMARAVGPRTRLVFVCNPHNPTGTHRPLSCVETFLDRVPPETLVVLDEAYVEYVEDPADRRALDLLPRRPNLVVLRTFSKVYGLAGLRVGYGIAHPALAAAYDRVRQPFHLNAAAQAAAEAALWDTDHLRRVLDLNHRMRARIEEGLTRLGLSWLPSRANFVWFRVEGAPRVYEALLRRGVVVRPVGPDALRVTTGTEEETDRFLDELEKVLWRGN